MSTDDNKLLVRRQFERIWNGGNWATADELYPRNMLTTTRTTRSGHRTGGIQAEGGRIPQRPARLRPEDRTPDRRGRFGWKRTGHCAGSTAGNWRALLPPASRSTWTDNCSAISSTAGSSKNGSTGTPWACSGRSALFRRPPRDRNLTSRSSAASFRAAATGHSGQ